MRARTGSEYGQVVAASVSIKGNGKDKGKASPVQAY